MSRAGTPSPAFAAARALYALAVAALPVTGLSGVAALGEMKGSASVYLFLAALAAFAVAVPPSTVRVPRLVVALVALLAAWLALDTALNYPLIGSVAQQGRSGTGKLATSAMVVGFGIAVAILSAHMLRAPDDLRALFLRPLAAGVLICAAFAVPEVLTWVAPGAEGLYAATTGLFHTRDNEEGRVLGRLISLAFEAPDLSYYAGFVLPWLILGARLAAHDPRPFDRLVAWVALPAGLALLLLSNSRTGLLMLAALLVVEAAFWLGLRFVRVPAAVFAGAFALCVLGYAGLVALRLPGLGAAAVAGEDVSTITRSALLTAQLAIFSERPWLGVGFGQNGFYVADVLPPWAWSSYEIERFFETHGEVPPSFSAMGRLGSELGIPGLLIWFGFWVVVVRRIAASAPALPDRSFALYLSLALLSSTACLIVGGTGTDPFRRPETWILIALAGLFAAMGPRGRRSVP